MMNRPSKAIQGATCAEAAGCPLPLKGIDLHLHSTFSDGLKTPDELCRMALKAGVSHLALCDHDTVSGVPAMREAAAEYGLALIPGVEVSTGQGGRTHILCYGQQVESAEMKAFLQRMAQERTRRAAQILDRLAAEGIAVPRERRAALLSQPSVGRAHIARELITLGAVNTVKQAFDRYLAQGRPAYVPRALLPTAQAVEALRAMKVVPVLAHPMRMGLEMPALQALVHSLKGSGLMGVECFHPSASAKAARSLDGLARQENLLVTGGSDYHGDPGSTVRIGRLPAGWNGREADLSSLTNILSNL